LSNLASAIGNLNKNTNQVKDDVLGYGDESGFGEQTDVNLTPETRTIIISENDLDGTTLFWDDDNQGDWDDFNWSGDNDMDGYTSKTWIRVINYNNTFEDAFETNRFVDEDNSTGTGDYSSDYDYTFASGEVLISKIIAANNTLYTKATLTVTGSDSDDTLYLSADGGSNWEEVTSATEHTFTNNSTTGIKYKILGGTTTSTITQVKVSYS